MVLLLGRVILRTCGRVVRSRLTISKVRAHAARACVEVAGTAMEYLSAAALVAQVANCRCNG